MMVGPETRDVRTKHGDMWVLEHDQYIGKSLDWYGEYSEEEVLLFEQVIRPGYWVLDVGANIGAFTLPLSNLVGPGGRVFAFEPQPTVFALLEANCRRNSTGNTMMMNAAVGMVSGETLLMELDYEMPGNFGGVSIGKGTIRVPQVAVDALCLPACHFMKIDVEGAELDVLVGAEETIQRHRPIIYIENDRVEHSHALISLLENYRYKMWWHTPAIVRPNNHRGAVDFAFRGVVSINMVCVPEEYAVNLNGFEVVEGPLSRPSCMKGNE